MIRSKKTIRILKRLSRINTTILIHQEIGADRRSIYLVELAKHNYKEQLQIQLQKFGYDE